MNKRKIKIILAVATLIFPMLGASQAFAADCYWKERITTPSGEYSPPMVTGGCTDEEYKSCAGQCAENTRPAIHGTTDYFCCPINEADLAPLPAPKFVLPDLQIKIPGLDFSPASCTTDDGQKYQCSIPWIGEYVKAIYNYGFSIAAILAALVLMAGGVLWLVSGGDASKVTQAREYITGSIVGLIILAASYILLIQINPELVKFKPISVGAIGERGANAALKSKNSSQAGTYAGAGCATEEELTTGADFYATGYCKPVWANTEKFRCLIAMNCECPLGSDPTKNCDEYFNNNKDYHPCLYFDEDVPYCNRTASGLPPGANTIAAPVTTPDKNRCPYLNFHDQVCFRTSKGATTYTITDVGGAINGKRIDIWVDKCTDAGKVTGSGTLTKGPCN
jgi:hypothetical protein